jgi:hypothetical protein
MKRREFIVGLGVVATAGSGCLSEVSSPQPAHTVTVYHVDHEETTRNVTVAVENEDAEELFYKEYDLSEDNESDEDSTFPGSADPETVTVEVDGKLFENAWPGFELGELPCEGDNTAGIEIRVEGDTGGDPSIRMETNCQHVSLNETG